MSAPATRPPFTLLAGTAYRALLIAAGLLVAPFLMLGPAPAGAAMSGSAAQVPDGAGLEVSARTADPDRARVVLTNRGTQPCQVATTSLGTVALTRVDQGGTGIAPILIDVHFGEAVDRYLTTRLHPLAPEETIEVPLRVVAVGPTGHALETVAWSASTAPIGSLYPIALDQPLDLELTYAVPAAAPEGTPLCAPAAGATAEGEVTRGQWWPVAVAVAGVLLALLALFVLVGRRRTRKAGAVPATLAVALLATGLVVLEWSTMPTPAHAVIEVDDSLTDAWADCSATLHGPGGDPANILPTLEGEGVRVQIIPANGDQTHHAAASEGEHFVFWDPDDRHPYAGNGGNADPCTSLYHELFHAYQAHRGELDPAECVTSAGKSGLPINEVEATRAQNLLHALLGLPERDHYGDTPLPTGDCLPPEEQPEPPQDPQCSGRGCGDSNGDPHLVTFDGARYDFQAVGEFIASIDPDGGFQVQVRQEPVPGSRLVSMNTAAAFDVAGDRVEVRVGDPTPLLLVEGVPRTEQELSLPGGGTASQVPAVRGRTVVVSWPDGSTATAQGIGRWGLHLTVQPAEARAGGLQGLLGDFDGDPNNDVRPRGGSPLTLPPAFDELYGAFADGWRVDPTTSLFTYPPGAGPQTYADPTFPDREVTAGEVPNRVWAEEVCRRAGVTEPGALAACTIDVALTGQPDFATAARATQVFLDVYRPEGPGTALTIDEPGDTATLTFQATAGESVFIDVGWTSLPNQCGGLRLLGPDGDQLVSGCLIGNRGHVDATVLPEDGEYTVQLTSSRDATGEARVWVIQVHDQEGPITPDGPELTATIAEPGAVARFTFAGRAGQKVFVDVPSATLRNQCSPLALEGPDGEVLSTGCIISGQGYVDAVVLPEAGEYTVVLDPGTRSVGRATVRLVEAVDQRGTISVGGPEVTAVIAQAGAVARFTFAGSAGQRVEVEVSATTLPNQCSPLRLHQPDGTVLSTGCVIGGVGDIAAVTLPEGGQYTLVVDPRDRTVGEATLRLAAAAAP
jgi:hypothetical protein